MFHLLGLDETRLQGVEESFQVLAMGMGHECGGTEKGWVGSKILLKNDMDECDKGEEMNPMEYVSNNGEKICLCFCPPRVRYSRVLQIRVFLVL